jgi:uncharacterized protein with HEPN domain
MRNVLARDYFGVNLGEVWRVIELDLPELKRKLLSLAAEAKKNE